MIQETERNSELSKKIEKEEGSSVSVSKSRPSNAQKGKLEFSQMNTDDMIRMYMCM